MGARQLRGIGWASRQARVMGAMGRDLNQATSRGAVVVRPLDCVALMGECIGYGKPNAPDTTLSALAHDTLLSNGNWQPGAVLSIERTTPRAGLVRAIRR